MVRMHVRDLRDALYRLRVKGCLDEISVLAGIPVDRIERFIDRGSSAVCAEAVVALDTAIFTHESLTRQN